MTKMTSNGSSGYDVFVKMDVFLLYVTIDLATVHEKKRLFISRLVNIVYRGFCDLTSEASCSSHPKI